MLGVPTAVVVPDPSGQVSVNILNGQPAPTGGAADWGDIGGDLEDQADLQAALDAKAAATHSHAIGDTTGLQAALDGKASAATVSAVVATVNAQGDAITALDAEVDGKSAIGHGHAIADVTGLQDALDAKAAADHGHAAEDIIGLATVATSGAYADLSGTPTLGTAAAEEATAFSPIDVALGEIRCTFDGGGEVIADDAGETIVLRASIITAAALRADVTGSVTVTVKRDRGGTLTTLGTLTLSSARTLVVSDLSGWTATDLASGDILIAEAASAATVTRVTLTLGRKAA